MAEASSKNSLILGVLDNKNLDTCIKLVRMTQIVDNCCTLTHSNTVNMIRWPLIFILSTQNALIPGSLNSWFQILQATNNEKIVFRLCFFYFMF